MTEWEEIGCQRGHLSHNTELVTVKIGGPTGYSDYPPVPMRFAREFPMNIWAKDQPPDLQAGWCPAVDAVSETIRNEGVWEVPETIVMLDCFERSPDALFVDIGAQIGWYSMLAATSGLAVYAVEADPAVALLLDWNLGIARADFVVGEYRVDADTALACSYDGLRLIVKIDIEGAESYAVNALRPWMAKTPLMDFMLIEMSPVFNDTYGELTERIMNFGYVMGVLPDKSRPPAKLDSIDDLRWITDISEASALILAHNQINVLFARPDLL